MKTTDVILEYISNLKRNKILDLIFNQAAWNWINCNIGLWDENKPTKDQIGKAYIGNHNNPKNELTGDWGYYWCFTNDYKYIRIIYNTVKNQYLDVNEDTEVTLTFEEFAKYI